MQLSCSKVSAFVILLGTVNCQKVKFMPLGDSITEITCWRAYLWDMLANVNMLGDIDFVGSHRNDKGDCVTDAPDFDFDNEGHSSWLGITIANNYLERWLALTKPDIVQTMLGTNDVFYNHSSTEIINAYTKMVGLMRDSNPKMQIIFDKLIPLDVNNTAIQALNRLIPDWAASLNTTDSPIYIADCSEDNGFTRDMLRDGIHPNDAGDEFMSKQIGPLVIHAVDEILAGRG